MAENFTTEFVCSSFKKQILKNKDVFLMDRVFKISFQNSSMWLVQEQAILKAF